MHNKIHSSILSFKISSKGIQAKKAVSKLSAMPIKQSINLLDINTKPKILHKLHTKAITTNTRASVQPIYRKNQSFSINSIKKIFRNASLDEHMMKLESITKKNYNARIDLLDIRKRMIELDIKEKLNVIKDTDYKRYQNKPLKAFIRKIGMQAII
jgi:hypothetical protein